MGMGSIEDAVRILLTAHELSGRLALYTAVLMSYATPPEHFAA